jgi:hypothetical protein
MKTSFSRLALICMFFMRNAFAVIVKINMPRANELPPSDIALIETVKETLTRRDRNLRSSPERRLDPAWCDRACRFVAFPFCQIWHPECYSHRRRLTDTKGGANETITLPNELRELQNEDCDAEKELILYELEQVISPLSLPVIEESEMACFEITDFCQINKFDLWNAQTDTLTKSNIVNGAKICRGTDSISIAAISDSCVEKVTFVLTGAGGFLHTRNEYMAPYLLYGNVGASVGGAHLPVGSYSLTVIPDDNDHLAKRLTFSVMNC